MGYIVKKSSVWGIKSRSAIRDKTRASPVCDPNPDGSGGGDPPQTPPGQIRRRQGESCSAEEWGVLTGREQRGVLWRWHHPSSDRAPPARALGRQSCSGSTEKASAGIIYTCLLKKKTDGALFKRVTKDFKHSTEISWTPPICYLLRRVPWLRQRPSTPAGDRDPRGAGRQPSDTLHPWEPRDHPKMV